MRPRLLLPLTLAAVTATAGVLWAQEPADAPSPRLMAIYAGQPEDAVGQAEARREIEALREELRRLASQQALSARDLAAARDRLAVLHVRETSLLAQLGSRLATGLDPVARPALEKWAATLTGAARDRVARTVQYLALVPEIPEAFR